MYFLLFFFLCFFAYLVDANNISLVHIVSKQSITLFENEL